MLRSIELTGVTPEIKEALMEYDKERREEKVSAVAWDIGEPLEEVRAWSDDKLEMAFYKLTK